MKTRFYLLHGMLVLVMLLLVACGGQATQAPSISESATTFTADSTTLSPGECTMLRWDAPGAFGVTLVGQGLPASGETEVCPAETTTYILTIDLGDQMAQRELEIVVTGQPVAPSASAEPTTPGTSANEPSAPAFDSNVPAYQAPGWVAVGGPPGGIGYDIRMQPDNPDIMYVTDNRGGVHKSVDGGHTWTPANQGIAPGPVGEYRAFSLTIDPHDYNTIWAGTQYTGHLYRSTDAGQTWEQRDNGISRELRSVRGITIDPLDPDILYIGVEAETDLASGAGFSVSGGEVYKSTDAGLNWTLIWEGDNIARYVWIDPRQTNRLYVSTGIYDREPLHADRAKGTYGGVGILRSDDAGETWTVLPDTEGWYVPSLFMHPDNPDMLLAAVTDPPGIGGVYLTRDGGDTWELILSYAEGADAVEISTSDTNVWYAATEDTAWRSDDAGQTWQQFYMGTVDRTGGIPIDMQADPRDPMRIFVNNYAGGNMVSTDGGETWLDASQGYTGALIGGLAVLPGSLTTVIAGGHTGSFRTDNGGQIWTGVVLGRLESVVFYYPTPDSTTPYAIAGDRDSQVWHSTDGGITWQAVQVVDLEAEEQAGRIKGPQSIGALAVAPSDPQVMYLGFAYPQVFRIGWGYTTVPTLGFCRSLDGGYTWEYLRGAPFEGVAILSIAVHPDDSQTVYTATAAGVFLSHDGGNSWQRLEGLYNLVAPTSTELFPAPVIAYDVELDPFDSQVVYVATVQSGVYRSADGGVTWAQVSAGMDANEPIYDLLPDPNQQGLIYASSWLSGLFVSTDGAQSWQRLSQGLTITDLRQLALSYDGSVLYAGSNGGGVYRLGTLAP